MPDEIWIEQDYDDDPTYKAPKPVDPNDFDDIEAPAWARELGKRVARWTQLHREE